jgi:hypothetical protein
LNFYFSYVIIKLRQVMSLRFSQHKEIYLMMKPSTKTNQLLGVVILTMLMMSAFVLSGFTIAALKPQPINPAIPRQGDETAEVINVLKNSDFEEWDDNPNHGLALNWEGFNNGQAAFGYYDENWKEAVLHGKHAQLLEINMVEANVLDRVTGVKQTVDVSPNSQYNLNIYAIMRTQAPAVNRNQHEFEMHWGIDFSGQGDYKNVKEWHLMPLQEQYRPGSSGQYPEDIPLKYEAITGTVATGDSRKVTLFIRGLKKFPTGTEVNFDLDELSLVGPKPAAAQPTPAPKPTTAITTTPVVSGSMPTSGATLPGNVSVGALLLSGLVFVMLGGTAAAGVLYKREKRERL